MRMLLALAVLLGACASPRRATVGPEQTAVSAAPSEDRQLMPERGPPSHAVVLARRLAGVDLGTLTANWPRRPGLPKPEKGYEAVFAGEDLACDGWRYEILVDLERPRVVWVRTVGTIAGIREYRGPAEIVDDSGPLVFRVGE